MNIDIWKQKERIRIRNITRLLKTVGFLSTAIIIVIISHIINDIWTSTIAFAIEVIVTYIATFLVLIAVIAFISEGDKDYENVYIEGYKNGLEDSFTNVVK